MSPRIRGWAICGGLGGIAIEGWFQDGGLRGDRMGLGDWCVVFADTWVCGCGGDGHAC